MPDFIKHMSRKHKCKHCDFTSLIRLFWVGYHITISKIWMDFTRIWLIVRPPFKIPDGVTVKANSMTFKLPI